MPELALDQIKTRDGFNPRADFDDKEHEALVKSIRARGLLQPLVVTPNDNGYYLVGGERRLRALIEASFTTPPVVIRHEGRISEVYDETEQLVDAITENPVRANLTPVEEAPAPERQGERLAAQALKCPQDGVHSSATTDAGPAGGAAAPR